MYRRSLIYGTNRYRIIAQIDPTTSTNIPIDTVTVETLITLVRKKV